MNLITTTTPLTMTSREIAEMAGKRHDHVMVDIRAMLLDLQVTSPEFSGHLPDSYGRPQPVYLLPKRETLILVSGCSVPMRAKIIDRWQELEAEAGSSVGTAWQQIALDALRRVHMVADAEAERATRHDFYRPASQRSQDRIAASVEAVAARHGLDPAAVRIGLRRNVDHVMAEVYGDPYAVRAVEREKARIESEVSRRLAAARKPFRRRR